MKSPRYNLIPNDQQIGQRVDQVLTSALTGLSRSRIQRLIESANVLVNGQPVRPSYKLKPGDKLEVDIPPPEPSQFLPENLNLNIIYEDDDLLLINKPAGLVVHPGAGVRSGTLANALAYHCQQLSSVSGVARPGIVHRLDKQTSGLLVVAKNDEAHLKLANQWRHREVEKIYLGLVYGVPSPAQGKIEAPIGRHPIERIKMAVRPESKGRHALTHYRVVEAFADVALVQVQIKTGRTHQIRVHMAYIRHPIVGDDVYGAGYKTKIKNPIIRQAVDRLGRYFLHAARLRFYHPRTNELLEFQADLPDELQQLLTLLRSG
ncbi:MAG: RluA family pseudouridine synthase [Acidobacteriota bacterium]|nr:RluA family pseudouridine synthase [Blastocatellia bacterium]MDW8239277.1 RluA family pseudouridine synthase [Acidobacteriota bacterium]